MKTSLTVLFFILFSYLSNAQSSLDLKQENRKGEFFTYWGWNRAWFGLSDISFKGKDYDFTLSKVIAFDRQSKFGLDPYFHISKFTIPQYNFKIGYFIHHNYSISLGTDHMKYVVAPNQIVPIRGSIANTETIYDGIYDDEDITIEPGFLIMEHTDGLNYVNADIRRFDELLSFHKFKLNLMEGIGAGLLIPKTNTTLFNKERYDQFHLSGYGINAVLGINLQFFKFFFIQTQIKGGYINMPNIRTSISVLDEAKQQFFFLQLNILFGVNFNFIK